MNYSVEIFPAAYSMLADREMVHLSLVNRSRDNVIEKQKFVADKDAALALASEWSLALPTGATMTVRYRGK